MDPKLLFSLLVPVLLALLMYFYAPIVGITGAQSDLAKSNTTDTTKHSTNSQNQFVMASIWLGIIGSMATSVYYCILEAFDIFCSRFLISFSFNNSDETFSHIMTFLGTQHTLLTENPGNEPIEVRFVTSPTFKAQLSKVKKSNWWSDNNDEYGEADSLKINFIPDSGLHVFRYKGKMLWITISSEDEVLATGVDQSTAYRYESCTLTMLGSATDKKNVEILQELVDKSMKAYLCRHHGLTKMYVLHSWFGWTMAVAKMKRPIASVILPDGLREAIVADAIAFLKNAEWYHKLNIPFRRGYLFYGVPGSGKSSLVSAMAAELNLSVCVLNLESDHLDDHILAQRMHEAPQQSIVLLEDVDAIFGDRNAPQQEENNRHRRAVTFSGLLNAIDGVASQEDGKIFIMTTNHIEKLDPALLRAGRSDVKVFFGNATRSQITRALERFFPTISDQSKEEFLSSLFAESLNLSMAQLTSFLCKYKNNPQDALTHVSELVAEVNENYQVNSIIAGTLPFPKWLKRLGLAKYTKVFESQNIRLVADISGTSNHSLKNTYKVKPTGDYSKILAMLRAEKEIVADFQLATRPEIERVVREIFPTAQANYIDTFAQLVKPETVSKHQLRNYMFPFRCRLVKGESLTTVFEDMIDNEKIQRELITPPTCHINVSQYFGSHLTDDNVHDFLKVEIQFETPRDWLLRLNETYKWWNQEQLEAPATINMDNEEKEEVDKKNNTKEASMKIEAKENEKNPQDNEKKEEQEPQILANLLKRLENHGFSSTKFMLDMTESTFKNDYKVTGKGRRIIMANSLKKTKTALNRLLKLKEEVETLFAIGN